jgi:hypothetical protein
VQQAVEHVFIDMGDKWTVKSELPEGEYMVHDTSLRVMPDESGGDAAKLVFVHRIRKIGHLGSIGQ